MVSLSAELEIGDAGNLSFTKTSDAGGYRTTYGTVNTSSRCRMWIKGCRGVERAQLPPICTVHGTPD